MSIVTKKGDSGKTSLLTGEKVSKADMRVEAYGTADELVSVLGLARAFAKDEKIVSDIKELQIDLMRFISELASKDLKKAKWLELTGERHVSSLEKKINDLEKKITLPRSFLIPGATGASSFVELARAVARRLERILVALKNKGRYRNKFGLIYVNRLSDYLFLLARAVEKSSNVPFETK